MNKSVFYNIGTENDFQGYRFFPTTFNKNVPLHTQPHYADKQFDKEQTVFGKPAKSPYGHSYLHYDYSDRIWQWDYQKADSAWGVAKESGAPIRSCRFYEIYLSAFFDRQVEIEHIIAGVNRATGYPYCVFGYKYVED